MTQSGVYTSDTHQVTPMALRSEQVCSYDMDDVDHRWLSAFNGERALAGKKALGLTASCAAASTCVNPCAPGTSTVTELEMERIMEELERQCFEKIHSTLKSNEEAEDADDGVICDVCRSVSI